MTRRRKPRDPTAAARSLARYERAAATLAPITLDAEHADALQRAIDITGETQAALVRRLIMEEAGRRVAKGASF